MMGILGPLTEEEWGGLMVTHAYMGPVPAFVYAGGQLMDYGVHSWDIREGVGRAHAMSADAADLLVPFMFIIWQSTIRASADLSPFSIGVTVTGRNAGSYRVSISDQGLAYEPGEVGDLPGGARIRRGRPGAHRIRPDQRWQRLWRSGAGRAIPEPLLPDLT